MKLVDKMKDENLGLAILYNFTKGYGHVPMSVYDVVLPFLYHDGFRNHLFEGVEVEEALTKCVQEDASFIQNILDTIEKDKEMTSRALGICLLNKYLSFEFEDNEMKGIYHESSILDINEAINLGKFFSGKSYEDILNILKKKSSNVVFLDSVCLGDDVDLSKLNQFGQATIYKQSNPEEVIERIKEADIIITNKCLLTEEVLQYASKVKLICITATGVNNVDLDYCHRRGITVCNVAGYSSLSVAQHTFALALDLRIVIIIIMFKVVNIVKVVCLVILDLVFMNYMKKHGVLLVWEILDVRLQKLLKLLVAKFSIIQQVEKIRSKIISQLI